MNVKYLWINGEPDLNDVLNDDVVRAVMNCDGVTPQDLDRLIVRVQGRLSRQRRPGPSAARLPAAADKSPRPGL